MRNSQGKSRIFVAILLVLLFATSHPVYGATLTTTIDSDSIGTTDFDVSGTLRADTLNEYTTAAGVTIDGVLLKDGVPVTLDKPGCTAHVYPLSGTFYGRLATGALVTSGSNAVTVINLTLDNVGQSGGGAVCLAAGVYPKTAAEPIWIRYSNLSLVMDPGVILRLTSATGDSVIRVSSYPVTKSGTILKNVLIMGGRIEQTTPYGDGITIDRANNVTVAHVTIDTTGEEGIASYGSNRTILFANRLRAAGTLASASTASLQLLGCVDCSALANIINGTGTDAGTIGIQITAGASGIPPQRVDVSHNKLFFQGSHALHFTGLTHNSTAHYNFAFKPGKSCFISDATGGGGAGKNNTFSFNIGQKCGEYGINILAETHRVIGNSIHGTGSGFDGIRYYQKPGGVVSGNEVWYAGKAGIQLNLVEDATVTGNRVHHAREHGIFAANGVTHSVISSNRVHDSGIAASNTYDGIAVQSAGGTAPINNLVHDNVITGTMMRAAIRLSGANTNSIRTNVLLDSVGAKFQQTGSSGNEVRGNFGYTTEARGSSSILSGQASVSVTHGLATTPTMVVVTCRHAEGADAVVTARTSTTFTLTVPSTVTADRACDWYAEV